MIINLQEGAEENIVIEAKRDKMKKYLKDQSYDVGFHDSEVYE